MRQEIEQPYLVRQTDKDIKRRLEQLRKLRRRLRIAALLCQWERIEELQHKINQLHG